MPRKIEIVQAYVQVNAGYVLQDMPNQAYCGDQRKTLGHPGRNVTEIHMEVFADNAFNRDLRGTGVAGDYPNPHFAVLAALLSPVKVEPYLSFFDDAQRRAEFLAVLPGNEPVQDPGSSIGQ